MGHKTCDQISRYERGVRAPSFQTALKLELIYGVPLCSLFPDHYAKFREEIFARQKHLPVFNAMNEILPEETRHLCTVSALLDKSKVTAHEIDSARKHAIKLHEKLSEVIGRTTFPKD